MPSTPGTYAVFNTTEGKIVARLFETEAPITVKNFIDLAEGTREWTHPSTRAKSTGKLYDGTIFHRVIDGFMIQGGGMTAGMKQKETRDPVDNEAANGLTNERYTIAMARTSDPHSATAQFFINVKDNDFLNFTEATHHGYGYCVFGKVVQGQEVVDKIKAVATTSRGGHSDVPREDVVIESASVM